MQQIPVRLTFFSLMLFSLLVYLYYSSLVVSARLDEPIFKINDSLNELGKMKLKFSSEWMAYADAYLKVINILNLFALKFFKNLYFSET